MYRIATRLSGHRGLPIWLPLALLTLGPAAAVAQTYTAFDCPGSVHTRARGINERGDIVGVCEDANGSHGFLLRKGVFTLIDAPDAAVLTLATGINNRGDVVGHYLDNEDVGHGFLLRHGHFTTIDVPSSPHTFPLGIDERGRIVGFYLGSDDAFRGFILDSHGFQDIEFPGAAATGAFGINARTWIVGGYGDTNDVFHGFLLKKGTFSSIDPPGAVGARAFGINTRGHIVGGWSGDSECGDCFVNAFLLTPRGFTNLVFPHALETVAWDINAAGQIVGHYFGEDESFHGFRRDPDGFVLAGRRTGGSVGAVDVDNATAADGAEPGFDFEDTRATLAWNDGDADDKTMTINLIDHRDPEGNQSFRLSLTSLSGGAVLAASAATTTIGNEVGPGIVSIPFAADPISRTEGDSDILVPVFRGGGEGAVSVSYTATGTATPGEDYVTSGTLTWADGETGRKDIVVDYLEDAAIEGQESFRIELNGATGGATIHSSERFKVMIIVDNDEGFSLPDTAVSVSENVGSLQIAIARSGALNRAASVDYSTANDTAVAGSDYSAASGTLTWAAGDPELKTIEIPITNDQDDENDESFTVSLSNPTGGLTLAPNSTASVTIVDNDTAGGGGGGGATGLELLALLGLLNAFAMPKRR